MNKERGNGEGGERRGNGGEVEWMWVDGEGGGG